MSLPAPSSSGPSPDGDAAPWRLAFGPFVLDRRERRLTRAGLPDAASVDGPDAPPDAVPVDVPVQGRAFDLVAHLAANAGALVRKDALFAAVWPGVVVSDAALTQAIRVARRALGDDAAAPTYIETVAGHGYRFIAPVAPLTPLPAAAPASAGDVGAAGPVRAARVEETAPRAARVGTDPWTSDALAPRRSVAGAVAGAAAAALVGGLVYGLALGADGPHPGSTLVSVCAFALAAGVAGAAAVAAGASLGGAARGAWRAWAGAAGGGALAGALVGLAGETVGRSLLVTAGIAAPRDLTGGVEGIVVGAALGLAFAPWRRGRTAVLATGLVTMAAFVALAFAGRPTFAGSLDAALASPYDPLRLDVLAPGGLTTGLRVLLGAFEGLVFGLGVAFGARR